jgi:hypothetical protein
MDFRNLRGAFSAVRKIFPVIYLSIFSLCLFIGVSGEVHAATLTLSKDQVLGFTATVGSNATVTDASATSVDFYADTLGLSDEIWCASSLCSIHNYNYARFGLSGFGDLSAFDTFRLTAQGSTEPYGGITYNTRLVAADAHGTVVVGDDINSIGSAPISLLGLDRTQVTFLGFDILTIQSLATASVILPSSGTDTVLADPLGGTPPTTLDTVASAPVPAAGLLFMSGLAGLGFAGRRARRKSA